MTLANSACFEIVDFIVARATPSELLEFHASEATQRRVDDLAERTHQGTLTADESGELADFLQLEHIMILAKAQASLRLASGH